MTLAPVSDMDRPMGLIDKLVFVVTLAIAVGVFLSVGWMAIAPDDPRGAVSLITHGHPVLMVLQAVLLVAVTAAIATVMIGGKLSDIGVFATGVGLALASIRGETAAYLLLRFSDGQRGLAAKFAVECLVWSGVMGVGLIVSGLVMRWCRDSFHRPGVDANESSGDDIIRRMAISECPGFSRLVGMNPRVDNDVIAGLRTTGIVTIAGLLVYATLASGSAPLTIRHGQVCFATFAAFYIGGWASRRLFPARTAFWSLLAIPLTGLIGYVWTMIRGESASRAAQWANIPTSDFLRVLPMTFVAVAALGALVAHWTIEPAVPRAKPEVNRSGPQRKKTRR